MPGEQEMSTVLVVEKLIAAKALKLPFSETPKTSGKTPFTVGSATKRVRALPLRMSP